MDGIPIRNLDDPTKLSKESAHLFKRTWDIHFRIFDMAVETDAADYETLMSAAASLKHVKIIKEVVPEGFGAKHWKLAIKWGEQYIEPNKLRGIYRSNGNPLKGSEL